MLVQNTHGSAIVVIISKTAMNLHRKIVAAICVGETTQKYVVDIGASVSMNLCSSVFTYTYTSKVST